MKFIVQDKRATIFSFVIMPNHIHLIWQAQDGYQPKEIQLSFMKYTAQMIIKDLRNNHIEVLEKFKVKASDRTYQIWERNALSVSLRSQSVFIQKLHYIHMNPVRAGLIAAPVAAEVTRRKVPASEGSASSRRRLPCEWPYCGAVIPGYPALHPLAEDYWERFWKLYVAAREAEAPPPSTSPPLK